jgi:hypothetical protein
MSTLREKFAQAIKETIDKTSYYVWTRPTESDPYVIAVDGDVDAGAIADALLPLIREAQAKAWQEGRDGAMSDHKPPLSGFESRPNPYRAAAYRVGEGESK